MMSNYFAYPTAAERYARGRPYFHPLVVERIPASCRLDKCARALDVGCGTGQSALALTEIAERVIGADIAADMLAQAVLHPRVSYVRATAERLPFIAGAFDLATVGLAFHWFDRARFLCEAGRVLAPEGWLVIYTDGFSGRMAENPAYEKWNLERYVARYPTPPRRNQPIDNVEAEVAGLRLIGQDRFAHEVQFSPEELVSYLITQTNVIAAVEQGREPIEQVADWLLGQVAPLFASEKGTFGFGCTIWYLRKV
jgi:SAM-dependent methyltransferase